MKVNKCDMCGAECGEFDLRTLHECYQSEGVVHVCPECGKELDALVRFHKSMMHKRLSKTVRALIRRVKRHRRGGAG